MIFPLDFFLGLYPLSLFIYLLWQLIILCAPYLPPEVQRIASSVIEMKEVKHPYMKGIKARKGIEF